jgi:hypothetical protein
MHLKTIYKNKANFNKLKRNKKLNKVLKII